MPAPPLPDAKIAKIRAAFVASGGNAVTTARENGTSVHTVDKYCGDLRAEYPARSDWAGNRKTAAQNTPIKLEGSAPEAEPEAEPAPADETTEQFIRRMLAEREARKGAPAVAAQEPAKFDPPGKTGIVKAARDYERIAWLSDLHHPFLDKPAFAVAMKALRDYRPELVILGGDLFDCFSISDHDKEPGRADTLQDEFDDAQPTWKEVDSLGCDVVFIKGNHEERIDRMQRKNPGLFRLRSLEIPIAAEMPSRWKYFPDQTQYQLGSLTCHHGNLRGRGTSSVHAAAGMLNKLRRSCIFGHLHRHQIFMQTGADGTVRAGYASGHLSDVNEAKYITAPDWQSGFSLIDFDWSLGIFHVTPMLVIKNALRFGSTTYTP